MPVGHVSVITQTLSLALSSLERFSSGFHWIGFRIGVLHARCLISLKHFWWSVVCQSCAVEELSVRGSGDSGGFWCSSSKYMWTLKVYKARRDRLQRLREECCTQLSSWGVPDFRRQAGLVEGHTQVDFRTQVQG